MFYWLIPLIIGFISLIVFLVFRVKEKRVIAVYLKGFTSLMFIITALVAWLTSKNPETNFGIFVLIGLFFGSLGDVFLDLKFVILDKEDLYTKLGFCAFGIGHIFYLIGLFLNFYNFNTSALYLVLPIVITIVFVVISLLFEIFTKIRYEKMKPFVIVYGFLLFFATTMYMSVAIQGEWKVVNIAIMAPALIMFAISDLILNNTYFAPDCDSPAFIVSNHICYYVAQFAVAVSLFFLI